MKKFIRTSPGILRKEDNAMYSKPEVTLIGDASVLIEDNSLTKGLDHIDGDGSGNMNAVAAYDLDD
jgi:hypothetical protein